MDCGIVLLENQPGQLADACVTHGLSYLIECGGKRILFDCGPDQSFITNAKLLNVDLSHIDDVVLSHSHYDHAAGYPAFLENFHCSKLWLGQDFFIPKYSAVGSCIRYLGCGFDQNFLTANEIQIHNVGEKIEIAPSLFAASQFHQRYSFETIPTKYIRGNEPPYQQDLFEGEVVLVKEGNESLSLIVGCSHVGILSITQTIIERFGKKAERIIGGIHLVHESDDVISLTLQELIRLGVKQVSFCHCSGECVGKLCMGKREISSSELHTGDSFLLS